jgi:hypothetical protein
MEPITLGLGPRTVRNTARIRGDKAEMHASITRRVVTFGPGAGVDAPCRGPEAGTGAPWSFVFRSFVGRRLLLAPVR